MICPHHSRSLQHRKLYDIEVGVCPACHGVWFDWQELPKLLRRFLYPNLYNIEEALADWEQFEAQWDDGKTLPKDFWQEASIDCPKGHGPLQKHYFAGSTVGVDQCQLCRGIWLEGNELLAVRKLAEPDPLGVAYANLLGTQGETKENVEKGVEAVQRLLAMPFLPAHQALFVIGNLVMDLVYDWLRLNRRS